MPGLTLNEIANEEVMNPISDQIGEPTNDIETEMVEPGRIKELLSKVLTARTGDGSINDYLDHPMNFNNSPGLAQMLRGFTGVIGDLKLAIIDIIFGALRFSKETKSGVKMNAISNGDDFTS